MRTKLKYLACLFFIGCISFIGCGFHKLFAYKNSKLYPSDNVNAVVGGDAYNYIINSNRAVAFFVMALICAVVGCTLLILNELTKRNENLFSNEEMI